MLNIQRLTKTYGEKKAVDDLSLHIAPGEIYGFIGHNGKLSFPIAAECDAVLAAGSTGEQSQVPVALCHLRNSVGFQYLQLGDHIIKNIAVRVRKANN